MFDLDHISQISGILTICCAMFLIFKEKIYLDAQTKEVMYVELPTLGRVKTNAPTLAVIVLGFVAVLYPLRSAHTVYVSVYKTVSADSHPVEAFVVTKVSSVGTDNHLIIPFPRMPDSDYQPHLLLRSAGGVFSDEPIDGKLLSKGDLHLQDVVLQDRKASPEVKEIDTPKPGAFQ